MAKTARCSKWCCFHSRFRVTDITQRQHHMNTFRGWETSFSLMLAYDGLARNHAQQLRNAPKERETNEPHPRDVYRNLFALLILNASIVEGTLRTILSERVRADRNASVAAGARQGRKGHDGPTRLLEEFWINLESAGSWAKLINDSKSYLGEAMHHGVPADLVQGIENLFVLRNVLAHGTALIQPETTMKDDMKGIYPFNWQSKLHGVGMYLEKQFGRGGVFENLAHPAVAEHFMSITKLFLTEIQKKFDPLPDRAAATIKLVNDYAFGYPNW